MSDGFKAQSVTVRPSAPESPSQTFLLRNAQHPKTDEPLAAVGDGTKKQAGQLVDRVSAHGWRNYLPGVGWAGTRAKFRYLVMAGGRRKAKRPRIIWLL